MQENQRLVFISRREYERVPFVKRLTVRDVESGGKYEANGIDISVKGIGFYSKKFFSKDTRVAIQVWLDEDTQKDPVWINATVKWSKLEQDGAVMGAQFDTLVKPTEHPKLYEMIYKVMRVITLGSTLL
ncbi:MAG: PilZ domain-containing protein [Sedimentisphaerales bacterium]